MKKKFVIAMMLVILNLSGCGNSQSAVSPVKEKEEVKYQEIPVDIENIENIDIGSLTQSSGSDLEIRNDPVTGKPYLIKGEFSDYIINSPEEALEALMSFRDIMEIDASSYFCEEIETDSTDCVTYILRQLYNDVIVNDGVFYVVVRKDNSKLVSVGGYFKKGISVDTRPKISADEGKKLIGLKKRQKFYGIDLVVYGSENNGYQLCWKYRLKFTDPLDDKIVYVNAMTGEKVREEVVNIS